MSSYTLGGTFSNSSYSKSIAITPSGTRCITGNQNSSFDGSGNVSIFNIAANGVMTRIFQSTSTGIGTAVSISDDGTIAAVTGLSALSVGYLRIYKETSTNTFTQIYTFTSLSRYYGTCVHVSGDGTKVFVGDSNVRNVSVYDVDVLGALVLPRLLYPIVSVNGIHLIVGTCVSSTNDGNTVISMGNGQNNDIFVPLYWNGLLSSWDMGAIAPMPADCRANGPVAISGNGTHLMGAILNTITGETGIVAYDLIGGSWIQRGSVFYFPTDQQGQAGVRGYISDNGNRVMYGSTASGAGDHGYFYQWNSGAGTWDPVANTPFNWRGDIAVSEDTSHVVFFHN